MKNLNRENYEDIEINNLNHLIRITKLKNELQNKINQENEDLNTFIVNEDNKTKLELDDLEKTYNQNKNNLNNSHQTQLQALPNTLFENYKNVVYNEFIAKQQKLKNSIEGTKRKNDRILKHLYDLSVKSLNDSKNEFTNSKNKEIENLENQLKEETSAYDQKIIEINNQRQIISEKNQNINAKIIDKENKLNILIDKFETDIYKRLFLELIKDINILTLKKPFINQNPVYNPTKVIYKYNEMSKFIDYLKDNFKFQENIDSDIHEYEFFNYGNNYLFKIEENFKNPYVNFELIFNKLKVYLYYPKINLIHPIYCDFIHNNVSNNNVLSYIYIKNKFLSESINQIENISYFKVTQSHINRIKIYFSNKL